MNERENNRLTDLSLKLVISDALSWMKGYSEEKVNEVSPLPLARVNMLVSKAGAMGMDDV